MIVVDANVLVSGLRSRNGASYVVLRAMLTGELPFAASPAVVLEYEDVLKRPGMFAVRPWIGADEIDRILDVICLHATRAHPMFRLRPILGDPDDDLYLECALAGGADTILTYDKGFDNASVRALGIQSLTPREFLKRQGSQP